MERGVVITVVKVAFFGNGSLSSSSPHADEPPKSGTNLGAKEKMIAVNDRKTIRPNHRDSIALTSVFFFMFQVNQFGFTRRA
jgi:hypothetical protein